MRRLQRWLIGPPYEETHRAMVMPVLKAQCDARGDGSRPFLIGWSRWGVRRYRIGVAIFDFSGTADDDD